MICQRPALTKRTTLSDAAAKVLPARASDDAVRFNDPLWVPLRVHRMNRSLSSKIAMCAPTLRQGKTVTNLGGDGLSTRPFFVATRIGRGTRSTSRPITNPNPDAVRVDGSGIGGGGASSS